MRRRLATTTVMALGCWALWVPAAFASAPVNDDFDDRLVLSNSLPIEVSGMNEGATKEIGEPNNNGFSAAGHSIWYEWEATSTGFVTIGACDSDFRANIGIYTGTSVDALTRVVSGNASEGPNCYYSSGEFTFKATSDTNYKIAVDGDGFGFPGSPPPDTEGAIALRIAATPVPANDDFAAATTIVGARAEEGSNVYLASTGGYNWGATKEAGEPDHEGDQGGASVWYSWTAPSTGAVRVGASEGGFKALVGFYAGDFLGTLAPVAAGPPMFGQPTFAVTGGTTYRLAVDGKHEAGAAAMARFSLRLRMELPPVVDVGSVTPDTAAPETTLLRLRKPRKVTTKRFAYKADEYPVTFRCRLDKRRFAACGPTRIYRNLKPGRHKFEVAAVDAAGNKDPTPATARFKVPKAVQRKGKA